MLPRLKGGDKIRYTGLGLVKELGRRDCSLLATASGSNLWNHCIIYHIVVAHEDLGLLAEFVGQKNTSLVLSFVFLLEYKVEAGHFLLNFGIMAPSDLIEILLFNVAVYNAFTKLCIARREIPFAEADRLTAGFIFVLLDDFVGHFDI